MTKIFSISSAIHMVIDSYVQAYTKCWVEI